MRRRDFNRVAIGVGLSPLLASRTLAQWYEGPSPPTSEPPKKFNIVIKNSPDRRFRVRPKPAVLVGVERKTYPHCELIRLDPNPGRTPKLVRLHISVEGGE